MRFAQWSRVWLDTLAKPYLGRSTRRSRSLRLKKFTSCVRPGVLLVRANWRRLTMILIALDFPAFERPANATSTPSSGTNCLGAFALLMKEACGYCDMGMPRGLCV